MIKKLCLFSLLLLLYSCTNTNQQRSQIPQWQFEGKFALNFPNNKQTGYIRWQHYNNGFDLHLWGALGMGTTKINVYPKHVVVNRGDQQHTYNNQQVSELLPGVNIPLLELVSNAHVLMQSTELEKAQQISESSEWFIQTLRTKTFNQQTLPAKLRLSNGEHHLTLLIKKWQ